MRGSGDSSSQTILEAVVAARRILEVDFREQAQGAEAFEAAAKEKCQALLRELDNDLAMSWVSLGLVHYSMGKLDDAVRDFNQALRREPLNADAYYGLGRVYEAQKKIPAAEAAHCKAITIRPDRMYYDELGSLYYHTGRTPEAILAFRKSIELAPDNYQGYRNLGAAYYAQGDLGQAAAQFQKALQVQPDSTLYGNLGNLYFAQGFYQQAVDAFEKALAMPGGANSYLQWGNLGDACRWTPDKKERAREAYLRGIQLIQEALRSTPEDVTLRSRLALYHAKRGDRDEALTELAKLEATAGKDASPIPDACGLRGHWGPG